MHDGTVESRTKGRGGVSRELMARLADVWASLAASPEGFICSTAAIESQNVVGGIVYGYWADDNPTAELGRTEGGHDFLVVDERWILDAWASAYYGERPIHDLHDPNDQPEITRLYGDRAKWVDIETREKEWPISFNL